jgi:hypothetical protein
MVEQVYLRERPVMYGLTHHELVCELRRGSSGMHASDRKTEPFVLQLEMLSTSWNDIVEAVQGRLGRHVIIE